MSKTTRRPLSLLRQFLDSEASGGIVLMAAAVLALIVANSPWGPAYEEALQLVQRPQQIGLRPVARSSNRVRQQCQPAGVRPLSLNTSESTVEKWETGAKRPNGMALKLLTVVQKHGLKNSRLTPTTAREVEAAALSSCPSPYRANLYLRNFEFAYRPFS